MFQHLENVHKAGVDKFIGRREWDGNGVREKLDGISDASTAGVNGIDVETPIGFHGGAKIPTFAAVGCPGAAGCGFLMDEDSATGGCNRRAIEIVGTPNLGEGRKVGVDARATEEIE